MSRIRQAALALLVLCAAVPRVFAAPPAAPLPTPQFRHYEVADGLPSSNVYRIAQDGQGLMWMATGNGLVRFDGVHFTLFRHDPGHPHSLRGNDVGALLVDGKGRVWTGGEGTGLELFDPATGGFRHFAHRKGDPHSLAGEDIGALAQAADGSLWISVMGVGLDRMRPDGRFEHLRHHKEDPHSLSSNIILSLLALPDGAVLAGGFGGLDRIGADGHITHVRFEGVDKPPRVWGIDGKPGDLRVATDDGLFRLDAHGTARRMLAGMLPAHMMVTSLRTPDGSLWVGSIDGLYWVGPHGRSRYFDPRLQGPDGVPGSLIWNLSLDREGGMWVGTRDGGVAYLCPQWQRFVVFRHQAGDPRSLDIKRVVSILGERDALWVGGSDGALDRIDPATGVVRHVHLPIGHQAVTALAHAGNGSLWIGRTRGMMLRSGSTLREVGVKTFTGGVNRIVSDAHGNAYVSAPAGGVYRIDRATLQVRELASDAGSSGERDINALAIYEGRIWLATMGGLLHAATDTGRLQRVPGTPAARVLQVAFAPGGFWLVRADGMEHYRWQAGRAVRDRVVGVGQGWPNVRVTAVFVDPKDRVWLATTTGLWRFDPVHGKFRSYGAEDGLPSPEFTGFGMAALADGTHYLGTMHGVVGFNPATIRDQAHPPHLIWRGIRVLRAGEPRVLHPRHGRLDLRWNDRDLRVAVQAVSYLDPARNHYRFRMQGLDTAWVDTGARGVREFPGLPAGDYRLQVMAAGPGGTWASLPTLALHVPQPPWLRWWARLVYLLLALTLLLLVGLLARRRIMQRQRVQMAEHERVMAEQASAAKTRFLATLGHEIRTPMTGVLGMAELLQRAPLEPRLRGYADAIQRSGKLLLRLVNEALDLARIEAGRLELDIAPFDPRELLADVRELESGLAQARGLALETQVTGAVPARLRGDVLRIQQILLNLVGNALKFTERGCVQVRLDWVDGGLDMQVTDTGPGIDADHRQRLFRRFEQAQGPQRHSGSGLGLAICRELALLMSGRCELLASSDEGSTFRVWLPLAVAQTPATLAVAEPASDAAWDLLLVEDDPIVGEVVREMLQHRGHRVRLAAHGLAALAELETGHFDAVLLDLDLPGMDGCALARMLRERGRTLPILAITARSGGDEETRTRDAGMNGFLRKPLDGARLQAALSACLQ